MKKANKIILGTIGGITLAVVPISLVVSCGKTNKYELNGKKFSNKEEFVKYAKSLLTSEKLDNNGEKIWQISNGKRTQYFSSPLEVREFIFKNKITTKKVFVPNKYKLDYKNANKSGELKEAYNMISDRQLSSFRDHEKKGNYYAFEASGGKIILSEQLTGEESHDKLVYEKARRKAIDSYLQIHQAYKFDNKYFPNKGSLEEYFKSTKFLNERLSKFVNTKKAIVLKSELGSAKSMPILVKKTTNGYVFNNNDEQSKKQSKSILENFIKDHFSVVMSGTSTSKKWVNVNEVFQSIKNGSISYEDVMQNINYIDNQSSASRYIVDIDKNSKGDFVGSYVVKNNGQVSRIAKSESWKHTTKTFDENDNRNTMIESLINATVEVACFDNKSKHSNILASISNPASLYLSNESENLFRKNNNEYQNFRETLNSYDTEMNAGLGDLLWEKQDQLMRGKRYSAFKTIFYLRTWLLDKVMRNNISDTYLINLINRFFDKGIAIVDYKLKEITMPILGKEAMSKINLSKIINFSENKSLFIDPEIVFTAIYKGRYQQYNTKKEISNPELKVMLKSLQIYFSVGGYQMERTESIKKELKRFKDAKENKNHNFGYSRGSSSQKILKLKEMFYDFSNDNEENGKSLKNISKIIKDDWKVGNFYNIDPRIKETFRKNVEIYLRRMDLKFRNINEKLKDNYKKYKSSNYVSSFNWDNKIIEGILSDQMEKGRQTSIIKKSTPKEIDDFLQITMTSGGKYMLAYAHKTFSSVRNLAKDFKGIGSLLDAKASDFERLEIVNKIRADGEKILDIYNKFKDNYKLIKYTISRIKEEFYTIKKTLKTTKNFKDLLTTFKTTIKNSKKLINEVKEINKLNKIAALVETSSGGVGMIIGMALDFAMQIAIGVIGETEIDGYEFKYGNNNGESIVWTGGKHTDHNLFGFSWTTGKVDPESDLHTITPIELTNQTKDGYYYNGQFLNSQHSVIYEWVKNIKNVIISGEFSKISGMKFKFQFGSFQCETLKELTEKVIKEIMNPKYGSKFIQTYGEIDNKLTNSKGMIEKATIDKIIQNIKPLWIAQLPELKSKNGIVKYDVLKYSMPFTKDAKIYKDKSMNNINYNKYFIYNPNKLDNLKAKNMEQIFSLFEDSFDSSHLKHKLISPYEAININSFDNLSNGFTLKNIYQVHSLNGKIETFLDMNDAIDWFALQSDYKTIPKGEQKIIYSYKGKKYLSITNFIESILKERKHTNEKEKLYK